MIRKKLTEKILQLFLIEEIYEKLRVFEIKWTKKKAKLPLAFKKNYEIAEFTTITKDNFWEFIS